MKESKRQKQVAAIIQREFSVVLRTEGAYIYGDEALVTVTNVRMTNDLGIAYIYVSVYNTLYKQEIIKLMWESLQRLRGELGKRIRKQVRKIPMIKFYIDDTLDHVERLDQLFGEMNNTNSNSTRSMKDALRDKEENNIEEE
ncbi:MAG: 30S ribosome-binding factor RbfA [Aureispira sp.]|nr:30S ribosome-binding factor RbfA [Aureispira sp.]